MPRVVLHAPGTTPWAGGDPDPGDGSITLSGSGFGSKATAAPLFFENFEGFAVGTSAESAGFDGSNGDYNGASVQDGNSHSGSRSLHVRYVANEYPTVSKLIPGGLTLYTAAWVYWERAGTATQRHIFKVFRGGTGVVYHGNPKYYSTLRPDEVTGQIDSHGDTGINNGDTLYDQLDDEASVFPQQGQWTFAEVKYVLSTPGVADGLCHIYYNGSLVSAIDPAMTRAAGVTDELAWVCPWLNGIDQRGDSCVYDLYEDEVLIDTTFARVIATDAADYASSTRWAPQAPSAWSDTVITIESPNWSDLTPGSTAYFHVFDSGDNHVGAFARTVPD